MDFPNSLHRNGAGFHRTAAEASGPEVPGPTALRECRAAPHIVCHFCCPFAHRGLGRATLISCHPRFVTLKDDEGDGERQVPGLPPTHLFMHNRELPAMDNPRRPDLPQPSSNDSRTCTDNGRDGLQDAGEGDHPFRTSTPRI